MRLQIRFPAALMTAMVAGVYSLVVCVLLLVDASGRLEKVPHDEARFVALKKELAERPGDQEIQSQIRALDLALREQYFRQQRFTQLGVYLLLGGLTVTLVAARWAANLRRQLPDRVSPDWEGNHDERNSRFGLAAVVVLMGLLVGVAWAMKSSWPTMLTGEIEQALPVRDDHAGP